jgi:hypothetical protein
MPFETGAGARSGKQRKRDVLCLAVPCSYDTVDYRKPLFSVQLLLPQFKRLLSPNGIPPKVETGSFEGKGAAFHFRLPTQQTKGLLKISPEALRSFILFLLLPNTKP